MDNLSSSYDFNSIFENGWTTSWNSDRPNSYSKSDLSDDQIDDEDRIGMNMTTPQAARYFMYKLGLLSGITNNDFHKTTPARWKVDHKGLLDDKQKKSFHGQSITFDNTSDVICRDDQINRSLRGLSLDSNSKSDALRSSVKLQRSFSDKFRVTISAVTAGNWDAVLKAIDCDPELLVMRLSKQNQTLLHAVVSQNQFVPEKLILKMLSISPRSIYALDSEHNTALHLVASNGLHTDLLPILLEHWKDGASQPNVDGNLPLHIAALGGKRAEINALVLLGVFPQSAGFLNLKGSLPLHMACSIGHASQLTVFKLLEIHRLMNIPIDLKDHDGYSPYQRGLKSSVPDQVLSAFDFYKRDEFDSPLDEVSGALKITSDERTSRCYDSLKQMSAAGSKTFTTLLEKLPIHLGAIGDDGFTKLHHHRVSTTLWWSLATDSSGIYFDTVEKILSEYTTLSETIALAKVNSPDGEKTVFDSAHPNVTDVILKNLFLCDSYQLLLRYPETSRGLLTFRAVVQSHWHPSKSCNPTKIAGGDIGQYESQMKDVIIHCTQVNSDRDEEMLSEVETRQDTCITSDVFQSFVNHHLVEDGRKFGCPGKQVRLVVLQRPYLTLTNVLEKHRFRKRRNDSWLRKCRNVLKQVVRHLQCLHESGYIHSYLGPDLIAKFDNNEWKLMKFGGIKRIGTTIDGEVRLCMPPESISASPQSTTVSPKSVAVSFMNKGEHSHRHSGGSSCLLSHGHTKSKHLRFSFRHCIADESWDAWSFGLIMGQLLLGPSVVLLPNFDRDLHVHMSRLFHFDHQSLQAIKDSMVKHAGDNAADLIGKLLEPEPEKRLKNMSKILIHSYFNDEIGHYSV